MSGLESFRLRGGNSKQMIVSQSRPWLEMERDVEREAQAAFPDFPAPIARVIAPATGNAPVTVKWMGDIL